MNLIIGMIQLLRQVVVNVVEVENGKFTMMEGIVYVENRND